MNCWGKKLAQVMSGVFSQGSRERSLFHIVVRDVAGERFIIEQVAEKDIGRKEVLAEHLSALKSMGPRLSLTLLVVTTGKFRNSGKMSGSWHIRPLLFIIYIPI